MLHYKNSGLNYVTLVNGYDSHKTDYGPGYAIREGDALDRALARITIMNGYRLRGQEVRFLRAILGMSQKRLADEIGARRVTVARWEGKSMTAIPGAQDRAIRIVVAREIFPDDLRHVASVFGEIEGKRPENDRLLCRLDPETASNTAPAWHEEKQLAQG